jgi:hypothetical protein
MDNLKEFYITFDPENFESGIDMIAVTATPAIELTALRFSKDDSTELKYKFTLDEEKRMIAGPVIIPNKKIYRRDKENGEYYVIFTEEVIEQMVDKFFSELRETIFNIEHNYKETINGFVKGSWIIEDSNNDKSNYYGFKDLPKGTFFIEAKISDDDDWNKIKEMDAVGFSIEGLMGLLNKNNKEQKFKQMSKKKKFVANKLAVKKMFNATTKKFEEVLVSDQEDVLIVEELEVGAEAAVLADDATVEVAEDGTYVIESEEVEVTIEEGVITEVQTMEESTEETEQEMASEEEEEEMQEEEVVEDATASMMAQMAEMMAKIAEFETRLETLEGELAETKEEEEMEFKATPKTGERVSKLKQLFK